MGSLTLVRASCTPVDFLRNMHSSRPDSLVPPPKKVD